MQVVWETKISKPVVQARLCIPQRRDGRLLHHQKHPRTQDPDQSDARRSPGRTYAVWQVELAVDRGQARPREFEFADVEAAES